MGITGHFLCVLTSKLTWKLYLETKKHLPKGVYIDREYTEDTERSRKILQPRFRVAKILPNYKGKSKLENYALIIHGKRYTVTTLHQLSSEINGFASSSKSDINTVAFFM